MAKEIEYKFLGNSLTLHAAFSHKVEQTIIYQGYLTEASFVVHIDLYPTGNASVTLTPTVDLAAGRFTYSVPLQDAQQMMGSAGKSYHQLLSAEEFTTRIRLLKDAQVAYLTIKSKAKGLSRDEFEYEIPYADALKMVAVQGVFGLDKVRYGVPYNGFLFEIDVYLGELQGLITVEVEVPDEKTEVFLPSWVGRDISNDFRYTNVQLAQNGIPL